MSCNLPISISIQNVQNTHIFISQIGKSEQRGNIQGYNEADNRPCAPPQGPKISENLLQINVFFQTLNVQTVAEEPKYKV